LKALIFKQLLSLFEFKIHLFINRIHQYAAPLTKLIQEQREVCFFKNFLLILNFS
jgi:hypothetical protein